MSSWRDKGGGKAGGFSAAEAGELVAGYLAHGQGRGFFEKQIGEDGAIDAAALEQAARFVAQNKADNPNVTTTYAAVLGKYRALTGNLRERRREPSSDCGDCGGRGCGMLVRAGDDVFNLRMLPTGAAPAAWAVAVPAVVPCHCEAGEPLNKRASGSLRWPFDELRQLWRSHVWEARAAYRFCDECRRLAGAACYQPRPEAGPCGEAAVGAHVAEPLAKGVRVREFAESARTAKASPQDAAAEVYEQNEEAGEW